MKRTFGACFTKGTLCFILNFSSMLRVCTANASCERSECFIDKTSKAYTILRIDFSVSHLIENSYYV